MVKHYVQHTTEDELRFLHEIGTFGEGYVKTGKRKDPIPLLKGYLKGLQLRVDWGKMDKIRVKVEAERIIIGLEGKKK